MTTGAKFSFKLSERLGSQFSTGESRRWASFRGSLRDPPRKLRGAAFVLEVHEGATPYAESPGAIGVVNVTPHAQPSDVEEAPFHAIVYLARSDFDSAEYLINVTLGEGHLVVARLTVQSDQFPADRPYPYSIDQIDFSGGFQGFVVEFNVARSWDRCIPPHQQPVSLPEKAYARKPSAGISIVVSSVYIDYSMPSGYVSRLICEGHIKPQGSGQDHLKGAECSIEFREYDLRDGRYPKELLSGTFAWNKSTRSFSVELRYRDLDLIGPLAPLFSFGTNDWMHIRMTLLADIAESKLGDQDGEMLLVAARVPKEENEA